MRTLKLGTTGPTTSALGLGCMGMSALYGEADRTESIATIHAALEAGVTLLDTGDFYAMGHNELLIGEALRTAPAAHREQALTSVKFGALRDPDGGWSGYDGRPAAVKNFAAYSLQRLGVDHIDVYRIARLDPDLARNQSGWMVHYSGGESGELSVDASGDALATWVESSVGVDTTFARFNMGEAAEDELRKMAGEYDVMRRALRRSMARVETQYGPIDVKVAHLNGRVVNEMPEFDQVRVAAKKAGIPVKEVEEATRSALRILNERG